jgi:hypothetical protein
MARSLTLIAPFASPVLKNMLEHDFRTLMSALIGFEEFP